MSGSEPNEHGAGQPLAEGEGESRPAHTSRAAKARLDLLLVERGLAESRERARRLILAGEVRVAGALVDKAGALVRSDAEIEVREALPYVSRSGLKLAAALDAWALDVCGLVAVDVGASTGGFTDCLLQRGVARVYAVDVGYGLLAWKVRSSPRVIPVERTNIRYLEALPGNALADLAVIDASFISLALVLPATLRLLTPAGRMVALVKPQFEAGRGMVGKGGVVRDARVHREVLERIIAFGDALGLHAAGLIASPAPGPAGNVEFLLLLLREGPAALDATATFDAAAAVDAAIAVASDLARSPRTPPPD